MSTLFQLPVFASRDELWKQCMLGLPLSEGLGEVMATHWATRITYVRALTVTVMNLMSCWQVRFSIGARGCAFDDLLHHDDEVLAAFVPTVSACHYEAEGTLAAPPHVLSRVLFRQCPILIVPIASRRTANNDASCTAWCDPRRKKSLRHSARRREGYM